MSEREKRPPTPFWEVRARGSAPEVVDIEQVGDDRLTDARPEIAHLFRRAGFGARPADLDKYASAGYEQAVADLLVAPATNGQPSPFGSTTPSTGTMMSNHAEAVRQAQAGWMKTIFLSPAPLVERMVLMLSDHFATAFSPGDNVDLRQLKDQQALFRRNALGNFRAICQGLLTDVALGCFLDHDTNRAESPNENLAREMLELFTLGVGYFTERDVKELARALTGYELRGTGDARKLVWVASYHDAGSKTILGRTGNFTPPQALDVVLSHPQAFRHIARRLATTFYRPDPPATVVDRVATALRDSGWELKPALRTLFLAPEFRSASARYTLVKSPAEFVGGAIRALRRQEFADAAGWVQAAGQPLFRPPNVGGWTANEGWLSAGAVLARYNAASRMAGLHLSAPKAGLPTTPDVAAWMKVFGLTELAPGTRAGLDTYFQRLAHRGPKVKIGGVITLLLTSPDYYLA